MTKCNTCHRIGTHNLKLGFAQAKSLRVSDTSPRFTISFETEGKFCLACVGRIERESRAGNFGFIGPDTRQEVATMFILRGWGEPSWEETSVEFFKVDRKEDALPSAPVDKVIKP